MKNISKSAFKFDENSRHIACVGTNGGTTDYDIMLGFYDAAICKDPSTIGREVLKHRILDTSQYKNRLNNYCAKRFDCKKTHICLKCDKYYYKDKRCATCSKCNTNCKDFIKETCLRNTSTPYVCNGCHKQKNCHLDKHFYFATRADKDYKSNLSEIRQGINIAESKLAMLDSKTSPLIINGQSPYQIIENHPEVNCSVKTLYNYIDKGFLRVKISIYLRKYAIKRENHITPK